MAYRDLGWAEYLQEIDDGIYCYKCEQFIGEDGPGYARLCPTCQTIQTQQRKSEYDKR